MASPLAAAAKKVWLGRTPAMAGLSSGVRISARAPPNLIAAVPMFSFPEGVAVNLVTGEKGDFNEWTGGADQIYDYEQTEFGRLPTGSNEGNDGFKIRFVEGIDDGVSSSGHPWTVSGWFADSNPTNVHQDELLSVGMAASAGTVAIGTHNVGYWMGQIRSNSNRTLYSDPTARAGGLWSHIAVVNENASDRKLYINGVVVTSESVAISQVYGSYPVEAMALYGQARASNWNAGEGLVGDALVFRRALSAQEIHTLWAPATRWSHYDPIVIPNNRVFFLPEVPFDGLVGIPRGRVGARELPSQPRINTRARLARGLKLAIVPNMRPVPGDGPELGPRELFTGIQSTENHVNNTNEAESSADFNGQSILTYQGNGGGTDGHRLTIPATYPVVADYGLTLALWIKQDIGGRQGTYCRLIFNEAAGDDVSLLINTTTIQTSINNPVTNKLFSSSGGISGDVWHLIVFPLDTYANSGNGGWLYIDGEYNQFQYNGISQANRIEKIEIGHSNGGYEQEGHLGAGFVWDRMLSPAEIKELYHPSTRWSMFEDTAGAVAFDITKPDADVLAVRPHVRSRSLPSHSGINWAAPISRGLRFAVAPHVRSAVAVRQVVDLVSGSESVNHNASNSAVISTTEVDGQTVQAYEGFSGDNDGVTMTLTEGITPMGGLTLSVWIRPDVTVTDYWISCYPTAAVSGLMQLTQQSGGFMEGRSSRTSTTRNITSTSTFAANDLVHCVLTLAPYPALGGRIFMDGVYDGQHTSGWTFSAPITEVQIAHSNGGFEVDGHLISAQIWDRVLSDGEIASLYHPSTRWAMFGSGLGSRAYRTTQPDASVLAFVPYRRTPPYAASYPPYGPVRVDPHVAADLGLCFALPASTQRHGELREAITGEAGEVTAYSGTATLPQRMETSWGPLPSGDQPNERTKIRWYESATGVDIITTPFNLSVWFYYYDDLLASALFGVGKTGGNGRYTLELANQFSQDSIVAASAGATTKWALEPNGSSVFGYGQWMHAVCQFNGADWRRLVINGDVVNDYINTDLASMSAILYEETTLGGTQTANNSNVGNTPMADTLVGVGHLWSDAQIKALYNPATRWQHYIPTASRIIALPSVDIGFGFPFLRHLGPVRRDRHLRAPGSLSDGLVAHALDQPGDATSGDHTSKISRLPFRVV
jgi:hypothetical protein